MDRTRHLHDGYERTGYTEGRIRWIYCCSDLSVACNRSDLDRREGRASAPGATAKGSVPDHGALAGAWLAGFGRSVASAQVDRLGERLAAGDRQPHLTLGGHRIGLAPDPEDGDPEEDAYTGAGRWPARTGEAPAGLVDDGPGRPVIPAGPGHRAAAPQRQPEHSGAARPAAAFMPLSSGLRFEAARFLATRRHSSILRYIGRKGHGRPSSRRPSPGVSGRRFPRPGCGCAAGSGAQGRPAGCCGSWRSHSGGAAGRARCCAARRRAWRRRASCAPRSGSTATGEIGSSGDRDWFAVDLVAGRTYVIDLRGSRTNDGTLSDPYLRGIHDADGNLISGTTNDDGGAGYNSRLTFTASETGTYYIAAGAHGSRQGTYELEVTDTVADDARDGAADLGDITDLDGPRFSNASLDGDGDRIDYFQFTLTEAKEVGLGLRQQDADSDLFLEDAEGNVLYSSTEDATANEAINETLLAGTYYVRVEAQEEGNNDFKLRYGVSAPDADEVARLEQQQQGGTNGAPAFGQQSYAFDLAENAHGSTDRVALGRVTATDPEAAALTYSIEGGNEADLFEIDASTGALSYKGAGEDYESGTTDYEVTVRASDGSLHSDVTVTVNVIDVAEAPAFAESSYTFDLAENADGSTDRVALGAVSATDPETAALTYSLEGGNEAGLFEIDVDRRGKLTPYRG